jgi:outer membrane receptor for ferrienterochelin and colicins
MHSFEALTTVADGARTWILGTRAEVENFGQTMTRTESLSTGLATQTFDEVSPQVLGRGALFAQLQWKLNNAVTLLGGVRGELHKTYGGAVTPRLALSYTPRPEVQLRASGGKGFRVPSAKELGFVFDHSSLGYRVLGNPALMPETSWGINGDATWRSTREITLRAGGFMNWVDNLIDIDLANGMPSGSVVDYRYENIGQARTFGVELHGTARAGCFRSELAYDYLFTRDDVNNRPLGGRPAHTLTASLGATLLWKLEVYARWRASSDAFVSPTLRAPGYQTIDLRLMREVWPKSQAYVGVLNLTDAHQDPGRVGDMRSPMGRVFYAGLKAELPWEEE